MPVGEDGLPDEGLSLWLTDFKIAVGESWPGRRLVALVGQAVGGHLDFHVHPDGRAVKVWMLEVRPGFQRRGLASVLMDALYAAYPEAWINHGARSKEGAWWWNSYRDPDPRRNVHNRPPAEWASYFDALDVASEKAQNAHQNHRYGLDGHRDAVYRYGERLEQDADRYTSVFRPLPAVRLDPAAQPLHGAARLFLPPGLHSYIHDGSQDAAGRAAALLEHLGHGNLPRQTYWNTTWQAAFADAYHEEVFQDAVPARPVTHVVFSLRPLGGVELPAHTALAASVGFTGPGDLAVQVAQMSWRRPEQPHRTHTAVFTPAVEAAIAPYSWQHASAAYRGRYDEAGFLRLPAEAPAKGPLPYTDRAAEIRAVAERLLQEQASRTPPSHPRAQPAAPRHPSSSPIRPGRGPGR